MAVHSDGVAYRRHLRKVIEDARRDEAAIGLIARDERFSTIQRLLWDVNHVGDAIRVKSAEAYASRWIRKGRLDRHAARQDLAEFTALVSGPTARPVRILGEVGAVLWARGQAEACRDLEALCDEVTQGSGVDLLCCYDARHDLQEHPDGKQVCQMHASNPARDRFDKASNALSPLGLSCAPSKRAHWSQSMHTACPVH